MSILISKDTTFIIQGITGREAVSLTRENLAYGAKIVGGVTPGRAGRDVWPLAPIGRFITPVRKILLALLEECNPDASNILPAYV